MTSPVRTLCVDCGEREVSTPGRCRVCRRAFVEAHDGPTDRHAPVAAVAPIPAPPPPAPAVPAPVLVSVSGSSTEYTPPPPPPPRPPDAVLEATSAAPFPPKAPRHTCPDCDEPFTNAVAVARHRAADHQEPAAQRPPAQSHPCPECGQGCATAGGLGVHRTRMHGVKSAWAESQERAQAKKGPDGYACPECGRTFPTPGALGGHSNIHRGFGTSGFNPTRSETTPEPPTIDPEPETVPDLPQSPAVVVDGHYAEPEFAEFVAGDQPARREVATSTFATEPPVTDARDPGVARTPEEAIHWQVINTYPGDDTGPLATDDRPLAILEPVVTQPTRDLVVLAISQHHDLVGRYLGLLIDQYGQVPTQSWNESERRSLLDRIEQALEGEREFMYAILGEAS